MAEELAVSVRNVSKCFKQYPRPVDRLKEMLLPGKSRAQLFWALKDIDLEVYRGETLGIIGQNGSGKSTLLQIIAGTLMPTTGAVQVNGRVSALLELGSGFNPEFTGRENVFLNGRLLGLTQQQVENKFDAIASFAEIGSFIEQPVKTYSSGMFLRLAFAVVANCDPQILIVDEALAVGDIFFQQKCHKFLDGLKAEGTAVIFVSHDTQAVIKLCNRAVLLRHGHLKQIGSPKEVVSKYVEMYYNQFLEDEAELGALQVKAESEAVLSSESSEGDVDPGFITEFPGVSRYGCAVGLIAGICVADPDGKPKSIFYSGETVCLKIKVNRHPSRISPLNIGFQVKDRLGQIIIGTNTCFLSLSMDEVPFGDPFVLQFEFQLAVTPQQYTISVAASEYRRDAQIVYDWIEGATVIDLVTKGQPKQVGLLRPEITTSMNPVSNLNSLNAV